jgi:hypothetical protein
MPQTKAAVTLPIRNGFEENFVVMLIAYRPVIKECSKKSQGTMKI